MSTASIPNRPVFRAQEVCELADVQAYVLRSWEAEFPDLGVAKTPAGPRVYRRADVERVLRIKQLVFVDGLTLAGARRRLTEEGLAPSAEAVSDADVASMLDEATRQELRNVRRGLQWMLGVLSGAGVQPEDFVLRASSPGRRRENDRPRASGGRAGERAKPVRPTAKRTRGKAKRR